MKYYVVISTHYIAHVDAEDQQDAKEKALDMMLAGELVEDPDYYVEAYRIPDTDGEM